MLAVLQEDTEMRVLVLPVYIMPLSTEENILPYELSFALASFRCRLFEYGSFSSSTQHVPTLRKPRGSMVIPTCAEVIRGSDGGQNAQVREGGRGKRVDIKCLSVASIWRMVTPS